MPWRPGHDAPPYRLGAPIGSFGHRVCVRCVALPTIGASAAISEKETGDAHI